MLGTQRWNSHHVFNMYIYTCACIYVHRNFLFIRYHYLPSDPFNLARSLLSVRTSWDISIHGAHTMHFSFSSPCKVYYVQGEAFQELETTTRYLEVMERPQSIQKQTGVSSFLWIVVPRTAARIALCFFFFVCVCVWRGVMVLELYICHKKKQLTVYIYLQQPRPEKEGEMGQNYLYSRGGPQQSTRLDRLWVPLDSSCHFASHDSWRKA